MKITIKKLKCVASPQENWESPASHEAWLMKFLWCYMLGIAQYVLTKGELTFEVEWVEVPGWYRVFNHPLLEGVWSFGQHSPLPQGGITLGAGDHLGPSWEVRYLPRHGNMLRCETQEGGRGNYYPGPVFYMPVNPYIERLGNEIKPCLAYAFGQTRWLRDPEGAEALARERLPKYIWKP